MYKMQRCEGYTAAPLIASSIVSQHSPIWNLWKFKSTKEYKREINQDNFKCSRNEWNERTRHNESSSKEVTLACWGFGKGRELLHLLNFVLKSRDCIALEPLNRERQESNWFATLSRRSSSAPARFDFCVGLNYALSQEVIANVQQCNSTIGLSLWNDWIVPRKSDFFSFS